MDTLLIELTNPKAMNLLQELEDLHLIRVLKKETSTKTKLSSILRGSITAKEANELNEVIKKSRNEWERNT
jgi:hypothetical protein